MVTRAKHVNQFAVIAASFSVSARSMADFPSLRDQWRIGRFITNHDCEIERDLFHLSMMFVQLDIKSNHWAVNVDAIVPNAPVRLTITFRQVKI